MGRVRTVNPVPIIALLLSLPTCSGETQQIDRLALVGQAIASVSTTIDDAAGLITIGTFESAWCASVHAGRQRGGSGLGLWQIEPGSNRLPPFAGLSLAATTHAAGEALWLWHHSRQCGTWPAARFRAYAGAPCGATWTGAARRAAFYGWASQKLRTLGAS